MITFQWTFNIQNIVSYDINTQNSNVIKTLGWVITGTDSEYTNKSASVSGSVDFDVSLISSFTLITDISNDILQSWVENRVGIDKINTMKVNLEMQLNNLPDNWNPIPNA
tara:strand:- start:709 stop:1038 length:330 start_codon:yes stop_codon:yes gene_type:complete